MSQALGQKNSVPILQNGVSIFQNGGSIFPNGGSIVPNGVSIVPTGVSIFRTSFRSACSYNSSSKKSSVATDNRLPISPFSAKVALVARFSRILHARTHAYPNTSLAVAAPLPSRQLRGGSNWGAKRRWGEAGVGVGSLTSFREFDIVCVLSVEIVTDPTPAPASPHRRFAPQLLPPRNCLEGRGVATAGEDFLGQLLYCCLIDSVTTAISLPKLMGNYMVIICKE